MPKRIAGKKVYDLVKQILEAHSQARNNDRILLWKVWEYQAVANQNNIFYTDFIYRAVSAESVTRARRKVVEHFPELGPTLEYVQKGRKQKESTKGTFIYREEIRRANDVLEEVKQLSLI